MLGTVDIKGIDHIAYQCLHYDEMLGFYQNVVGLHLAARGINTFAWIGNKTCIEFSKVETAKILTEDRSNYYGYKKMNFEVKDINCIKKRALKYNAKFIKDVHKDSCGSFEVTLMDPDGNTVEFTEYNDDEKALLGMNCSKFNSTEPVKCITQVAFNVQNENEMLAFYTDVLGFRLAITKTNSYQLKSLESNNGPKDVIEKVRANIDKPWIDFIEVAPHQYIELFHSLDEKKTLNSPADYVGFKHLCFEVDDVNTAHAYFLEKSVEPLTNVETASDGSYHFWMSDPDGNRVEIFQLKK